MKQKPRKPPVPAERYETIRQGIVSLFEERTGPLTARDISVTIRISEKDVYFHLAHIRRSMGKGNKGRVLSVTPATCKKCGFEFKKRERLTKPGKCPVCNGESIEQPLFSLV
ncbi:MAG: transcriptional regulator [Nitrospirae bacterium]|nr:transcriptional regulator [Nitrospirota bacterium]